MKLYNAVRTDDILAVQSLLEDSEIDKEQALDFIPKTRFPPDDLSYLHVASSRDSPLVLKYFLEACDCDPCVKEKDGKPPYSMASNKEIKDIFIQFRVANPNKYNWLRSHIPEPQILSAEEEAKLAEKKKAKKAKQKEKQRAEKELAKKEEEERQEKARWLAMSERDRRGILVERRLAGLPLLTRCDQCATVIPDKPFQYETFKFCSPPCVNQHRAAVK
ncbi:unnamed protein product [Caenorhabditis auriculariae]|uniref:Vms1-associating treble clef domain-containing protein n=1 Tax=Caenorhabditis auriculariae TaxID=2777116 RepID=A0A8S1H0A4_9PELO|nr:unnamed protein product [Caenorhabditis auriculariae]